MIRIANAPCSWGVLEFDLEGESAGYEQVLDEMKETGYEGTELGDWGFMPTEPDALKQELEKRELELLGAFVPVAFSEPLQYEPGLSSALRTVELMTDAGYTDAFIVLSDDNGSVPERTRNAGRVKPEMGLSDTQWEVFAQRVNTIAGAVREKFGLRSVFHHHCAGYVETPDEVRKLMQLTDPQLVGLCLDMGHYRFGGGDPLEALGEFAPRIWHVHFKDCEPQIARRSREEEWDYFESVRQGVFCELGKGEVNFKAIAEELKAMNYNGWIVVEQDVLPGMGAAEECAARNREFIKGLGL